MTDRERLQDLELASDGLNDSLGDTAQSAAACDTEIRKAGAGFAAASKDIAGLERGMSNGLRRALDGVVFDGDRLSEALRTLGDTLSSAVYSAAIDPVTDQVGQSLSGGLSGILGALLPFAAGGSFAQGRVMPFASGGIVNGPTMFPMRGGLGLMGEAGPEAIMPLARGADGKLGVRGTGGTTSVVINVSTPDVQGFQRSQGQIAAQISRALGRGNRNR